MSLGRYGKNYRSLVHHAFYGDAIGPATQVGFVMAGPQPLASGLWDPVLPGAARAVRIGLSTQCGTDTNPGNWTLRLRRGNSTTDLATASIAITTAITDQSVLWTPQVIFEAGWSYWIVADGASKDTVIIRPILEWEVL
jgi:hypothetical protein